MGRAFEVRKAAMARTGAQKTRAYSKYGRELYQVAKQGGADPTANLALRRLIEIAKRNNIPGEIINRALEKARGNNEDNYQELVYEVISSGGAGVIIRCLSDNVNRTISDIRGVVNKCQAKLAGQGSLLYQFHHYSFYEIDPIEEDALLEAFIMADIDLVDSEYSDGHLFLYSEAASHQLISDTLASTFSTINVYESRLVYQADDTISLTPEQTELFNRLLTLLEQLDDVQEVFHNAEV